MRERERANGWKTNGWTATSEGTCVCALTSPHSSSSAPSCPCVERGLYTREREEGDEHAPAPCRAIK